MCVYIYSIYFQHYNYCFIIWENLLKRFAEKSAISVFCNSTWVDIAIIKCKDIYTCLGATVCMYILPVFVFMFLKEVSYAHQVRPKILWNIITI